MPSNDQVILREYLNQQKKQIAPETTDSQFFELFCSEQVLKSYDPSYEEIELGIVGGGDDGGIDSIYAFLNGVLVLDDTDPSEYQKGHVTLELVIVQAKRSSGFEEAAVEKLLVTTQDLLDLNKSLADLTILYNPRLLSIIDNYRRVHKELIRKFPKLIFRYYYATEGETDEIHPKVNEKAVRLKSIVKQFYKDSTADFKFLGASELLSYARTSPVQTHDLPLMENAISKQDGYICLVGLSDYHAFITDENGELRSSMLESNVRDYQGATAVNQEIRKSLENPTPEEDFWWLNNGITVIGSKGSITGKTLVIEDARIVNGLQTSVEIFNYFNTVVEVREESRNLLVRVIITDDEECRDRIIRATNSQTTIPSASLIATGKLQRDIEEFFRLKGLYYDRRKNYYKNKGEPREKIISIQYLSQAVMSILLCEPDNARARPTSLLKARENEVFNDKYPIFMYLSCARILRRIDDFLRASDTQASQDERTNFRFHLAMCSAIWALRKKDIKSDDLIVFDIGVLGDDILKNILNALRREMLILSEERGYSSDRIAKSREFRDAALGIAEKLTACGSDAGS